ncbi:MAG: ABC transporter substrate-binding protein [Proteobacteria bacterium]|nr:ABC transporter substrate-binding protein [Pseudomonadota bacterium]MBU1647886.1 ABC transporter substrate-binding protein [Pseudomonadota bacterium]
MLAKLFRSSTKKKTVTFRVVNCVTSLVLMMAIFSVSCSSQKEPVKIGAILSLTGPGFYLQEFRNGMEMAADDINRTGGINGHKIELIVEDSKTTPEGGKAAFQKLEKEHNPLFYVVNMSSIAMATRDMAEEAKVPLIAAPTAAKNLLSGKEWIFRYWVTAQDETPPITNILNKLNVNRLGVIYLDDPYGKSLFQQLEEDSSGKNRSIIGVSFPSNTKDFETQIKEVQETDAIYIGGFASHISMILTQIRATGYSGHLLATSGAADTSARKNPAFEGVYLASPMIYNQAYPYTKELSEKYTSAYHLPLSHYAATGYDIVKLVAGLLSGQELSRENVKKLLEQGYNFPGSMGDIRVVPGSHEINFQLYPAQIRQEKIHFLSNTL